MKAQKLIDFLQEHSNAEVFMQSVDSCDNLIEVKVVGCRYSSSIDESSKSHLQESFVIV